MALFDFLKKKEFEEIALLKSQLLKYQPIIDIDKAAEDRKTELQFLIASKNQEISDLDQKIIQLNTEYQESLGIYTKLRKEVSLFESKLDLIEFGIYEPVYDFEKSDDYRREQNTILEKQKKLIQDGSAAYCTTNWKVEGSEAKGRTVVTRYQKLMLRAFNGECDALVAKVKWNNINQMKERMSKLFETVNKLGEGFSVFISTEYLNLKMKELVLEHEYRVKRQKEKDELRQIQEDLREEEKARREIEVAQRQAEKEEADFGKALEKARKEVEQATGERLDSLLAKIAGLESDLLEAQMRKDRALSMAQQTRRGHVYIISNIGSFGETVFKIGLTRRLDPEDRVKELGDASVPFQFDIHAMIFSEDAPTLENELHRRFDRKKVNMINYRKEFFNVTIDEIENAVREMNLDADFIKLPEAMEYRETQAILEKLRNPQKEFTIEEEIAEEFPSSLLN